MLEALTLCLALWLAEEGPVNPQPITSAAVLAWDAPTLNADGSPCTDLGGYVVAITEATVDLNVSGSPLAQVRIQDPAVCQQSVAPLISQRTPGLYRLWVRAFDLAGNDSTWSVPLVVVPDSVVPQAPGNPRIKVTVTVEVGG